MYKELINEIEKISTDSISEERKLVLNPLVEFIQSKIDSSSPILLNFICTHNSRRSHFSQIWGQIMAEYHQIPQVFSYSGGTEATALYPQVLHTLKQQGVQVETLSEGENPVYQINIGQNIHPILGFSKVYEHNFNPKSNFAAIMTCSQADEGCPFVFGCEKRISIPFNDPKAFDQSQEKEQKYLEKSIEIASEMKYVFSNIKL